MANENCLEGMACPGCKSEGPFYITATSEFLMSDDGTEEHSDVEYGDDAPCRCYKCKHAGKLKDFRQEEEPNGPSA